MIKKKPFLVKRLSKQPLCQQTVYLRKASNVAVKNENVLLLYLCRQLGFKVTILLAKLENKKYKYNFKVD